MHTKVNTQTIIYGIIIVLVAILVVPYVLVAFLPSILGSLAGLSTITYNYTNSSGGTSSGNTVPLLNTLFSPSTGIMVILIAVAVFLVILGLIFYLFAHHKK